MLEILFTILIVYLLYYVLSIHKFNKFGSLKKSDKTVYEALPKEAQFFVSVYHIDLEKINVRALLNLLAIVLGISITFAIVIANWITKDFTISIILSAIFLIPIYLIGLKIVSIQIKERGNENGKHKTNRKKVAKNMGRK